ncbi:cobalamin biosynthesis protein CobG [Streptomyces sp. WM6372]|uniref:cobalamin biosynthesis protein CobG n=1 Tax=Streptomyces sp. WM6372 TaxID=1415555 RepID=UPI0006C0585F|nr:cobalamin biosynthesis protein CobG [Streptomyces sp. WM6372]KOU25152.1 cobalamin biosynthesis protein CobG [Streptomyces sp. WM6372]
MPPQPPSAASRDEPVIRDRGDACPGALRLHAADDGHLARIRIPGGMLDADAALLLADAADRLGDGHIDLTSRGNAQLRGLGASCGGELQAVLVRAGLLPAPTHERVRNIVASPLTGLDRRGLPDVAPWVAELDRLLCASAPAAGLSGRFLFALDDGRGDVTSLAADVNLAALRDGGRALLWTAGAADALLVAAADAPRAALVAASYFLDAVRRAGTRAWRVAELPAEQALRSDELGARLAAAGISASVVRGPAALRGPAPEPGVVDGPDGAAALSVFAPLGRLTTAQWRRLAGLTGRLRLTPWRGIVVPGLPAHAAGGALAGLAGAGLVTGADDPWRSVTACTGQPGCAKSLADVRADARAVVAQQGQAQVQAQDQDQAQDQTHAPVEATRPLPVHWSGCERRCGHPRGTAWADVVATADGYDLCAPGRAPRRGVPASELPAALAAVRRTTSHDAAKK